MFDSTSELDEWSEEFINIDKNVVFELVIAANFLNIEPLLNLACKKVADMIRGKSPTQLRREFGIPGTFSEDVQASSRDMNWSQ